MSNYSDILYKYVTLVIGVLIVICNTFKIVYLQKKVKTKSVIYITNLALSDCSVGVFMVILKTMDPFMDTSLKNNDYALEIYLLIRFCCIRFSLLSSVFNLVAITLTQVVAVVKPYYYRKWKTTLIYKICAANWFISITCVLIFYFSLRFKVDRINNIKKYKNLLFPFVTFPVICLFIISYTLIAIKLYGSNRARESKISRNRKETTTLRCSLNKEIDDNDKRPVLPADMKKSSEVKYIKVYLSSTLKYEILAK